MDASQLLSAWYAAKTSLENAKLEEHALRLKVFELFGDKSIVGTTQTVRLGGSYKLSMKIPVYYKFSKDADGTLDDIAITNALEEISDSGPMGMHCADELVRWKPELSVTTYKQLTRAHQTIIDRLIEITHGMPTVDLVGGK